MRPDLDLTAHFDGYAIWFEGELAGVWKTQVCARAAMKLAESAGRDSNAMLAACLAQARRDA
jgi:hypothetical protein